MRPPRLQRRASFQTRKGRCNFQSSHRPENRFRFSGRCARRLCGGQRLRFNRLKT
ncbi:hypothetical protein GR247_29545 [Rhizobium leguminosarum]|nr:hypothetical protein [Rhizobium leguminosarum]